MDIASVIGLVVAFVLMVFGIVNDKGFVAIQSFIHAPSAAIVFGGALGVMLAMNPLREFIAGLKSFLLIFKTPKANEVETIKSIIELSNLARREGLLALEESANNLDDEFMKKGVMLIVDGTDPELVRSILEADLVNIDSRHQGNISFWKNLGAMGPAWGMIGTLIGLINMLKDLSDPDSIGPNMSVALITTLYGSVLANWICSPVANKLTKQNDMEIKLKEVMIEGILSIQAGENPRVIEEKLKAFLAPKERAGFGEEGGGN
ncbi:MAG: motility protein A [Lachnospiraceae bacterium]|nr:motility protein A [Lachnospiraceae bacterium]